MNYTLHQLQVFLKITQECSITRAAEELHLSQPAVSIQLKNFQDQFEIPLTEIIGRKLHVTDFGKEIAEAAEKILEQVSAIDTKTAAYKGLLTGRLKISVVSTAKYVIPYFLTGFLKENPNVELKLDVTNKSMVISSLEQNEVDFGMVSLLPEVLPISYIPLMTNQLFLVAGKDYEENQHVSTNDLFSKLTLIYREKGSGTRLTMERFLIQNNIPVKKKLELTSNEAVKQAVIAGLGCSVMPLIGIKNELITGDLKIIPVKGMPIITNWNFIYLKNKKLSPVSLAFIAYLNDKKEEIIANQFDWISQQFAKF
jgi:LysR family transcriptional regulator, low CO2-responsive transcriptional regulator